MLIIPKAFFAITAVAVLFLSMDKVSYQQLPFFDFEEDGEYLLKANLRIADGATFEMSSNEDEDDNLQYHKIAGENGIIVHGRILINGIKITSWDVSSNDVVQQDSNGSVSRGYIQFDASEGSEIVNSEFAYLGYNELGRRGFDLH